MPTYEYRCEKCGGRFEIMQRITADALTTCPIDECVAGDPVEKGEGKVRRIVSGGSGVLFKGDGFYVTDYVRKGGGDSENSTGSTDSSSSESKSDSSTASSSSESSSSDG